MGLYPLLPDYMEVDRDSKGVLTYKYTNAEGVSRWLRPEDVLHIPGLGFDGIIGYSPVAMEKNAIGLGISAEEYLHATDVMEAESMQIMKQMYGTT